MSGSTSFTFLDLTSGLFQLTIHKEDRNLTTFRETKGSLWKYAPPGLGLKTEPSAFADYVQGSVMEVKKKVVRK